MPTRRAASCPALAHLHPRRVVATYGVIVSRASEATGVVTHTAPRPVGAGAPAEAASESRAEDGRPSKRTRPVESVNSVQRPSSETGTPAATAPAPATPAESP